MGGSFDTRDYEYDDRAKITKHFEGECETSKYEDGTSYPGTIAAMHTVNDWRDKRFSTRNEAENYMCEEHSKWDEGMAVSYLLPRTPTKGDEARVTKAREALEKIERKQFDVTLAIQKAFTGRKAKLVACKCCGSRLARDFVVKTLGKGYVSEHAVCLNGRPREVTFDMPCKPKCALCGTSLLSETDQTRLDNAHAKAQAAQTAYDAARVPKATTKIGWLVGGWCSS